jgi:formate dehydrogenase subunit gamma
VHGVITFYHYFRSAPPARCTVQICRAEACQSMGGDALLAHAEQALGCKLHEHSGDGGSRWSRSTAWASAPPRRR